LEGASVVSRTIMYGFSSAEYREYAPPANMEQHAVNMRNVFHETIAFLIFFCLRSPRH
jgi:hypothetical protein